MAFFKFRLPNPGLGDDGSSGGTSGESLEALRRRARQRLIGATVLVLLAVVGFPLLFDTQPRPVSVDIPIDIPDKQKTPPQTAPAALKPAAEPNGHASGTVPTQASLERHEEVVQPASTPGAPAKPPALPVNDTPVAKVDGAVKPASEKTTPDKPTSDNPAADKALATRHPTPPCPALWCR